MAIEALTEAGKLPPDTITANFNGLRGLDGMKNLDALVVAGRVEPPVYAVEEIARALWPDQEMSLGHAALLKARTEHQLRNGSAVQATVRAHPDPLVNRVLAQHRDYELLQAVGRIRPIHAVEQKEVYLLGSTPVPGLVIDELTKACELLPDDRASQGLLAGHGTLPLAPSALVKLLPGEWQSENAAKCWVRDTLKGWISILNILDRNPPLYHLVRYRLTGQPGRLAEALTWLTDEAAIRTALEAIHGRAVTHLEVPAPAGPNPSPEPSNETEVTP